MQFEDLTAEAKLVFIIGEPLRHNESLSVADWHRCVFAAFVDATGLDWDEYVVALSQVSDWFFSPSPVIKILDCEGEAAQNPRSTGSVNTLMAEGAAESGRGNLPC